MANWFTQFQGTGEYSGGAGLSAYKRALDAGYTPQQIKDAAPGSGLHIGSGLRNTLANINSGGDTSASELAAAQAAASSYQSQLSGYQSQLQGYQSQLSDWSNRYSNMQSQMQGQYQTAMTGKNEAEGRATEFEGKFKQATEDYESAKKLAETYRGEAVNQQLDSIRRGATYQGGQVNPYASIASGAVSNRQRQDEDMLIHVDKQVSAEDSVLERKGPVVQAIGSGNPSPRRGSDNNPLAGGGSPITNYYSNRFG